MCHHTSLVHSAEDYTQGFVPVKPEARTAPVKLSPQPSELLSEQPDGQAAAASHTVYVRLTNGMEKK